MRRPLLLLALSLAAACGQQDPVAGAAPEEMAQPAPAVPEPVPPPPAPLFDAAALGVPSDPESIADGEKIAISHCAICHGPGQEDSLRADAPPLRHVLSLYAPESLSEDFRAGIHVGHEAMPDFVFGDLGMDVLLAYLVSIQEAPPGTAQGSSEAPL